MRTSQIEPSLAAETGRPCEVLLTVSGDIPATILEDIARRKRPRSDYVELAKRLGADLLDYTKARTIGGALGRTLEGIFGPNVMLAYACWRVRHRYRAIATDGEQVGIPLAGLFKLLPGGRPQHVMITHIISARKKVWLMDALRLASQIDTFVVYSRFQQDFIRSRWRLPQHRTALIPFMVDEQFFDPALVQRRTGTRPRICAVGLERRDYPTLLEAVDGLDVDVVVAAASPWSKQQDDVSGGRIPSNVTISKLSQFDLRQLYADCAFMVMPLQRVDFQAGVTAMLEAMAMGRPVICSRAPGQTDVIVDGVNGCYVPVGDAPALRAQIARFLADPDEVARLGANARAMTTERFGLDVYAGHIFTIVQHALSKLTA